MHANQIENPRFKSKSKVRGRNVMSPFESQGKLKISKVNTVAPFPFPLIEKIQSPITYDDENNANEINLGHDEVGEDTDPLMYYLPGIFTTFENNNMNYQNNFSIIET